MSDIVLGILIAVVVGLVVYLVWQSQQPTTVERPGWWNWRGWPWWWFGNGPSGGHWRPSGGGGRPHPRPRPEPHPFGPGGEHHTYPLGPGGEQRHLLGPGGLGPSGTYPPPMTGGGRGSFTGGGTRLRN